MTTETQERRSERLTVACTPAEERAARFVALAIGVEDGISGLLRQMSLNEIVAKHAEMQAKLAEVA